MRRAWNNKYALSLLPVIVSLAYCLYHGDFALLRPDQKGLRLYNIDEFSDAATAFSDPVWKGVATYRDGSFEAAAGIFAGQDTAPSAYNQANSLAMQGKYTEAVARYDRALELQSDWDDALVNRRIAIARAEMLRREGGEGTGGKLGADEIVFGEGSSSSPSGEEVVEENMPISDTELQALWLRQVQTRPADFLRAKFSYQFATAKGGGDSSP
jgi:Ca-activated chloride channel family protein